MDRILRNSGDGRLQVHRWRRNKPVNRWYQGRLAPFSGVAKRQSSEVTQGGQAPHHCRLPTADCRLMA
jgi:hypothetical protein